MDERKCINRLREDFQTYAKFVPENLYNEKIYSIIVVQLRNTIARRETIRMDADIYKVVLELYPDVLKAFDEKYVKAIIIKELDEARENGKTKKDIAKKYELSEDEIESILESIKETNPNLYNEINDNLEKNKSEKKIKMLNDIINLDRIIELLGPIKNNELTSEQKLKFTYLYGKHIHNSLDDIAQSNYRRVEGIRTSKMSNFLGNILKIQHMFNLATLTSSIEDITLKNEWYKNYDRDEFFGMKNGVPTIDNKYGKKAELLTLNIEYTIVEMLKAEEIPLKDFVVRNAFREYFKDNLFEFIYKLKEYDREFEELKEKSKKQ